MWKHLVLLGFSLMCFSFAIAQSESNISLPTNAQLIVPSYAFQFPAGDLSQRFGTNSSVGGQYLLKIKKNWLVGFELSFLFGTRVKDDNILDSITTSEGLLINVNGNLLDFGLFERGFSGKIQFGKSIKIGNKKPDSGLMLLAGIGMLQHKIFINVDERDVPQLSNNNKTGYDRLARGFSTAQFLGYLFLRKSKFVSFYAGVEAIQGFTTNKRNFDFHEGIEKNENRTDLLFGIKIGWVLPVFQRSKVEEFYYN